MEYDSTSQVRGRRSPAPWFLLLAVLLLFTAGVTTLLRSRAVPRNLPPSIDDPEQPIEALRGEAALAARGRLVAELTPLYTDPGHLEFEANALRRRLGLGDGSPWRLRLRWDAPAGSAGALGKPGGDVEQAPQEALALGALRIVESAEVVAATLEFPESNAGPIDPVQALFACPRGSLGSGEAIDFVVWGRAVKGRARLQGLAFGGEALALQLEPTTLARAELELPLTHEVRGDEIVRDGKNAPSNASPRSVRSRSASDG